MIDRHRVRAGEWYVPYIIWYGPARNPAYLDILCRSAPSDTAPRMPAEVYGRQAGILELKAEQRFEARLATREETGLFGKKAPAAVLNVTSLISGPGGAPIEYRRAVNRGDRYWFNMERSLSL